MEGEAKASILKDNKFSLLLLPPQAACGVKYLILFHHHDSVCYWLNLRRLKSYQCFA